MVKVHTVPQTQSHCIQMLVLLVRVFLCLWHINIHEQFSAGLCGILHRCPKLFKVTCNLDSRLNLTGKSRIKLLCDVFSTRFNFNDSVFWAEGVLLAVVLGTGARWGGAPGTTSLCVKMHQHCCPVKVFNITSNLKLSPCKTGSTPRHSPLSMRSRCCGGGTRFRWNAQPAFKPAALSLPDHFFQI